MAFLIMLGNLGGTVGSNIYLEKQKPHYWLGFGFGLGISIAAVIATIVLKFEYQRLNRVRDSMGTEEEILARYTEDKLAKLGDRSPLFRYIYNQLPDDGQQPAVPQATLDEVADMFCRHGVFDKFGLHLVHSHFNITADEVMLGSAIGDGLGCWTKTTSIGSIKLDRVHGHIFMLSDDNDLVAYEYRGGGAHSRGYR
ncbi:hypothetical protein VTK73DRAFT_6305 [Phialemonium thermophilum]|uniref:Uncharacterized protein n=1 Tax=Phialemonium thermophilum TaxID=223376 RepID=A0ABR3WKD4_9PEZI